MKNIEEIKKKIISTKFKYISFDIFDTALIRPFLHPSDLFYLLDKEFEKYNVSFISFYKIRVNGEMGARSELKKINLSYQDITLEDIYDYISKNYHISKRICNTIKSYEEYLELHFCRARRSIKNLYDFALKNNKKLIFISDMYLDKIIIEKILQKNGYKNYEKIFVSSEEKVLKKNGDMFQRVFEELGISCDEIFHIGDDINSDVNQAKYKGIDAWYYPKTIDKFKEYCGDGLKKDLLKLPLWGGGSTVDYREVEKSMGFRCMIQTIANYYFDNPYKNFQSNSDFNRDPCFIGYYAVGMHLLGINQWIFKQVTRNKYRYIWFTSRDGWLPMHAYNLLRERKTDLPEGKYLYLSREATLPIQIINEIDFYDLPIEYWKYSPKTLLSLLEFCSKSFKNEEIERFIFNAKIDYNKNFKNELEYNKFMSIFLKTFYSKKKHEKAKSLIYNYLSVITEDDIIFDIGYSGRIHNSLCQLLKIGIDVLFIYQNSYTSFAMSRKGKFDIYTFYDFTPSMPGLLREFFLSDYKASCNGYEYGTDGKVEPTFDEEMMSDYNTIEKVQSSAIQCVENFYDLFGDFLDFIPYKSFEVSMTFEGMLGFMNKTDREIFADSFMADKIYGRNPNFNVSGFWKNKMNEKLIDLQQDKFE